MSSLIATIINETERQFLKKRTIWFVLLSALLPIGAAAILANFQQNLGLSSVSTTDFPILILGVFTSFLLPLFVFMAAADMFAGEISSRTMKITLLRPITRFKVYASKHITLLLHIVLYLAVAGIASISSGFFFHSRGDTLEGILDAMISYGVAGVPFIAIGAFAILAAQLFRSASTALVVCILIYLTAYVVSFFLPGVAMYSLTSYTDWHSLWLNSSFAGGKITSIFMFLTACSILLFTVGFYLFDRKEY
jgi:ABC-2 type transport system permease protein